MAIGTNSNGTFREETIHKDPGSRSVIQWLFSPGLPDITPDQLEDLKQRALMELKADKQVMTPQVIVCLPIQIQRQVTYLHGVLENRKIETLRTSDGSILRTSSEVDRLVEEIWGHRARTGTMGDDALYIQKLAEYAKDQCGKAPMTSPSPLPITREMEETFMAFMSLMDEKRPLNTAKKRRGNKKVKTPTKAENDEHRHALRVAEALGIPEESTENVRAEARARVRRGEFLVSPRAEIELDDVAKEVLRREIELCAMRQELSFDARTKIDEVLARTPTRPVTPAATQEASTPERS